jgi:hypothetical protein
LNYIIKQYRFSREAKTNTLNTHPFFGRTDTLLLVNDQMFQKGSLTSYSQAQGSELVSFVFTSVLMVRLPIGDMGASLHYHPAPAGESSEARRPCQ